MYKCNGCGEVFEQPKEAREAHGFTDGTHETLSVCPCCGADYSEAEQCKQCGEWRFEDEIFGGLCADCLESEVDYKTAFEYMKETEDFFQIFMFERFFESETPSKVCEKLDEMMVFVYWQAVTDETQNGIDELLKLLKNYILEEDGDFGKADFAEWLNERGCKNAD